MCLKVLNSIYKCNLYTFHQKIFSTNRNIKLLKLPKTKNHEKHVLVACLKLNWYGHINDERRKPKISIKKENISIQPINMSLFRRKKPGKVFPVKISTMDAELEFSLDYKVPFITNCYRKFIFFVFEGNGPGIVWSGLQNNWSQGSLVLWFTISGKIGNYFILYSVIMLYLISRIARVILHGWN